MPHGSEQISQSPCQIERYIGNLPVHLIAHLREAYCSLRQILLMNLLNEGALQSSSPFTSMGIRDASC